MLSKPSLSIFAALALAFAGLSLASVPGQAREWPMPGTAGAPDGTPTEGFPSRLVIVSHQVENPTAYGNAKELARTLGAVKVITRDGQKELVYGLGENTKSGGIIEQAKALYDLTGIKVSEIHTVGHTQSGFLEEDNYFQLKPWMGKQLKPYVTDDVRIVFHGCDATWQGGYMDAFLMNLPDGAEIYGHAQAAQPGEPFDWVHWYKKVDANGKLKAHHDDMGKTPVIDELFPMVYAEWWAEINVYTSYDPNPGITAFQAWTSQPFVKRVPSDIEDLMRQLMKKK